MLALWVQPALSAEPIRILAFGDSLTAGYGLAEQDGFVPQLSAALQKMGRPATVINGGVSGDTSAGGLARLDWALMDDPEIMILELGANDMLRGLDPEATRDNLDQMIAKAKSADVEVLLVGMQAPNNFGPDYKSRFDTIYSDLAAKHDLVLMPFFLEGVATDAKLNQSDGIHPNKDGVSVIVQSLLPYLTTAMDRVLEKGRDS